MIFWNAKSNKSQAGFTLVELLVAAAIIGILAPAIAVSVYQTITGSGTSNNRMTAINSAQSACDYISLDAKQVGYKPTFSGTTGFPLTINWNEYGNSTYYNATYTFSDKTLSRRFFYGNATFTSAPQTIVVARNIENITCAPIYKTPGEEDEYIGMELKVTTKVHNWPGQEVIEQRTYQIKPRTAD